MIKQILSIALAVCLCVSMVFVTDMDAKAADPISMMVSYTQARIGKNGQQLGYTNQWCAFFVCDSAVYAGQEKAIPYNGNAHTLYFAVLTAGGNEVLSPQAGDLVFYNCTACDTTNDGISIMHVGLVENEGFSIEGNLDGSSYATTTVKRKALTESYSHGSGHNTSNYVQRIYVRPNYSGTTNTTVKHTVDTFYGTNITAYPKAKITAENIFDSYHNQRDSTSWIGTSDKCTIHEVYTDGCCKVTYPLDAGGTKTVYSKISLFNVSVKAPDKTEISIAKTSYTEGETITVSWTEEAGTTYYWINVYKDGELIVNKSMDKKTSYTLENAEIGEYKIAVSANNSAGNSGGSSVSFSVAKIGAPLVSSSKAEYKLGQTVEISWDAVPGAVSYAYYLSEYPEEYAYTTNVSNGRVSTPKLAFSDLPNGRYVVFVCAVSNEGKTSAQSNWVTFYIYNSDYIPIKTVTHNGHKYVLFDEEMSWDFAKILCSKMGGYLATITSEEENACIAELISYGDKDAYWLGASNVVQGSYKTTGEPFKWVTNEVFDYTNWKSGEPSQGGEKASTEHFLEIRKSYDNKWNDVANTNRENKGFILEIDVMYTVTYDANGGSGAPGSQTKYHNTTLTLSNTKPTKTGYTFLGWSTSSTATSATYQPGDIFEDNTDITLYAVWEKGCEGGAHIYNFEATKAPTSSSTGMLTGTCPKCADTITITIPKLNATDYVYEVLKAATCTATGKGRYTWTSYGGFDFDVTIPKAKHAYISKVTPPTSNAQGYTTYTCSVCGDSYVADYTDPLPEASALVITSQPQSVIVEPNAKVELVVEAEGEGLTYTWYYSNNGGESWTRSSLSTTNVFTIASCGTGYHNRQYRVEIADANGNKVTSEAATVQVKYLIKDSATAFGVPVNTDHVFSVQYSVTEGVTYQWQYKGNTSNSTWANTGMTGNKTPNLTVKALSTRNGYSYRCIITVGGEQIISKAAILYVASEAAVVTKNPEPATAVCGDYATFTIEAQGEGALYHWQWYHEGTDTWVSTYIAGYHTPELKVKTNNFNGGRLYRCRIRTVNGSGWNEVYTEPAMLTVLPAAEVSQQPQNITVKAGETAQFSIVAEGEGLTYQWQWAKFVGNWKNTSAEGATTEGIVLPNVSAEMNGRYYRVIITNQYGGTYTTEYAQLFVEE